MRSIFKRATPYVKHGLLVAVEGLDGSGKTTVIERLLSRWPDREVVLTNWNDTKQIYNLMMHLNAEIGLDGPSRCLLGAVELAARYEYRILPALDRRAVVFANKYLLSAMVHSLIRGEDRRYVELLYDFAFPPDLTLYFEITPEVALARKLQSGQPIGFWEAGLDLAHGGPLVDALRSYREREVDDAYLASRFLAFQTELYRLQQAELATTPNLVRLDGEAPSDQLVDQVASILQRALDRRAGDAT